MDYEWKTDLPGVLSLHSEQCPVRDGGDCTCGPLGYVASVRDLATNERNVSGSFESVPEALAWQQVQMSQQSRTADPVRRPRHRVERMEIGTLIQDFLQAAEHGLVLDSQGLPYTPEAVRELKSGLSYVDTELGHVAVDEVRRRHIQELVAELRDAGVDRSRVFTVVNGLTELYSYAARRELVEFSPLVELDLGDRTNGTTPSAPRRAAISYAEEPWPGQRPPPDRPPSAPWGAARDGAPAPSPGYPTGGFTHAPQPGYDGPNPSQTFGPSGGPPEFSPGYPTGGFTHAPQPGYPTGAWAQGPQQGYGNPNVSQTYGLPVPPPANSSDLASDVTAQERWLWWTVRIIVIVFVLIALVLVAESV